MEVDTLSNGGVTSSEGTGVTSVSSSNSVAHNPYTRANYKHPPNETVYVRNLNERLSKAELKRVLFLYFGQFGRILDIVALKTERMRGQAFIVFKELSSATKAVQIAQEFELMGKSMDVSFAKTKSKAHFEHIERVDYAAAISRQVSRRPRANLPVYRRDSSLKDQSAEKDDESGDEATGSIDSSEDVEMHESHKVKDEGNEDENGSESKKKGHRSVVIIEGLPRGADESELKAFFDKFSGFVGFHSPKRKPWMMLAFYSGESAAIEAIHRLQGMRIRDSALRLSLDI